jgi:O-antigen ligase
LKLISQIVFITFLAATFLFLSRILDPLRIGYNLPAVLAALLGIGLFITRRAFVFWKTTAGKILPVFVVWMFVSYLLTPHNENSLFFLQSVMLGALLFAASCGLPATVSDFKKVFGVAAAAGVVAALLGIVWGAQHYGRFALRNGPYSDPNYYAMWLLAFVPLIWTTFADHKLWIRIAGIVAAALPLLIALRTGSRAGFVAIGAMAIVAIFFFSLTTRILLGSAVALALVGLVGFAPNLLRNRLNASAERSGADQNSVDARQTLLVTSLAVTLTYPLFGVGAGNFPMTVVEAGREQGKDWSPLVTHNSYTQISSETGLPGIILYLLLIGFSVKNLISLLRQTSPKGATPDGATYQLARGMLFSLAVVLTFLCFLSEGYNFLILFWLGLAGGLRLLAPLPGSEEEASEWVEELAPEQ